jgi:hypothetical protein
VLFPVNPFTLAKYREALTPSRAKDDPTDAALQVELLLQHRDKLTPLTPPFLRQTFVAWAAESTRHAFWAQVYDQQQRDKGKAHQAAVRALAFTWIRILYRCWQERTPYDESTYLQALTRRGSSLIQNLAKAS